MDRCLSVTDIVYIICEKLSEPLGLTGNFSNELASLAALARTCRAVHEPALDHLWHTQTSIIPYFAVCQTVPGNIVPITKNKMGMKRLNAP